MMPSAIPSNHRAARWRWIISVSTVLAVTLGAGITIWHVAPSDTIPENDGVAVGEVQSLSSLGDGEVATEVTPRPPSTPPIQNDTTCTSNCGGDVEVVDPSKAKVSPKVLRRPSKPALQKPEAHGTPPRKVLTRVVDDPEHVSFGKRVPADRCVDLFADATSQTTDVVEVHRISATHIYMMPKKDNTVFCAIYLDNKERAILKEPSTLKTAVLLKKMKKGNIVTIYTTDKNNQVSMIQMFKGPDSSTYKIHGDYWQLAREVLPHEPPRAEL
ncbi:uncharacterized protein BXIN_0514 [Babesia sp. Xinjiang]|uniref:uncharacterized protein n=1 Tax=Babesia sp. Xinjiang TaxID=462227 RepID=UPI000A21BD29|nr:uncharacterized protein BXIN_0514 [Babesia sp. Xinjiang]ORM41959.1 hypothetical protein BXIN_0514 [Babesia sp. Xinjiang]